MHSSIAALCQWIDASPLSQRLQDILWLVPLLQTVHILVIGAVFSSVVMIALRLIGLVNTHQSLALLSVRYLRVIWWSLPILLLTGSVLVIIEPVRDLLSPAFQLKMALIVLAVVAMLTYQRALARDAHRFDGPGQRLIVGVVAGFGLLIWVGIVFAGRWIAYAAGGV